MNEILNVMVILGLHLAKYQVASTIQVSEMIVCEEQSMGTRNLNPTAFLQAENSRLTDENTQLKGKLQQMEAFVGGLDKLYTASDHFEDDSQLMPLLQEMLQVAIKIMNAPDGSLMLLDDEAHELVFMICVGDISQELQGHRIPVKTGIAGWVAREGKPAMVPNVQTDPRFSNQVDSQFGFKTQSIAAAPLIGGETMHGVIEVLNHTGDEPFSDFDVALLKLFCRAVGEALTDLTAE